MRIRRIGAKIKDAVEKVFFGDAPNFAEGKCTITQRAFG
jgi:hypothetical protein